MTRQHSLPNGMEVAYQSLAELGQFYEDIFEKRIYTRNGIRLGAGACVFDVGANIGLFSLFVASSCPGAWIFAVEPAPPLLDILRANVARCGTRVEVVPCGLAGHAGSAQLTFYPHTSGMSSFHASAPGEKAALLTLIRNELARRPEAERALLGHAEELAEQRLRSETWECPLRRFSDVVAEHRVERIDLLKIDVEKSEMEVLAGIDSADWRKVRQIVMEVHDLGDRLREVRMLLRARGFAVWMEQDELYAGSDRNNVYAVRET
jgi:phthiocerol/phenolphthiocerol synthesis type-I polyketide synthase E